MSSPVTTQPCGDIAMNQASTAMLDDHENIQLSKGYGDREEKVAGNDPLSVQAKKSGPPHIPSWSTSWSNPQILVHRSRRDLNSQLQQQFNGNSFLAPRGTLIGHPPLTYGPLAAWLVELFSRANQRCCECGPPGPSVRAIASCSLCGSLSLVFKCLIHQHEALGLRFEIGEGDDDP